MKCFLRNSKLDLSRYELLFELKPTFLFQQEQQQRIKQLESKHSDLKKVDKKGEEEDDEAGEYDEELG